MSNPSTSNSNSHQHSYSKRATSKTVAYKGVWVKKPKSYEGKKINLEEKIRYAAEFSYTSIKGRRERIWLGTYNTPEEGALAYDLASNRIMGKAPNETISENGEIKISMSQGMKEKIKSGVEEKISSHFGTGDASKQPRANTGGTKRSSLGSTMQHQCRDVGQGCEAKVKKSKE